MLTGITSQKQLEEFLTPLKPRQRIKIVFSERQACVAMRVAELIYAGLLSAEPVITAALQNVGWHGSWGESNRTFEFALTNEFTQPQASQVVAEAIWFGVGSIEVTEG